ncbi:MAG: sufT [Proteobacteria bacterium]|nr:sufT [Pseudomonadota bacterium]
MDNLNGANALDLSSARDGGLEEKVITMLRTIYDPEIPVNIYDLGLIYNLEVEEEGGHVQIQMTLTAPGCPVAQTFPQVVANTVGEVEEVNSVEVELVWDPPWSVDRMSEAARLQLGML